MVITEIEKIYIILKTNRKALSILIVITISLIIGILLYGMIKSLAYNSVKLFGEVVSNLNLFNFPEKIMYIIMIIFIYIVLGMIIKTPKDKEVEIYKKIMLKISYILSMICFFKFDIFKIIGFDIISPIPWMFLILIALMILEILKLITIVYNMLVKIKIENLNNRDVIDESKYNYLKEKFQNGNGIYYFLKEEDIRNEIVELIDLDYIRPVKGKKLSEIHLYKNHEILIYFSKEVVEYFKKNN